MSNDSARALWIFAVMLAAVAAMVPSPSGKCFFSAVAALAALPPALFGPGRARLGGALACAVSLALAAASFPAMRRDQVAYAESTRKKNAAAHAPAPVTSRQTPR